MGESHATKEVKIWQYAEGFCANNCLNYNKINLLHDLSQTEKSVELVVKIQTCYWIVYLFVRAKTFEAVDIETSWFDGTLCPHVDHVWVSRSLGQGQDQSVENANFATWTLCKLLIGQGYKLSQGHFKVKS